MSDQRQLISQLLALLEQGHTLVDGLDEELYGRSPEPLTKSPVGAHVRHVLDGCRCFLDGLGPARIDYDHRERKPEIEVDPQAAAADVQACLRRFRDLSASESGQRLLVRSDVLEGTPPEAGWRDSTVGRELLYLLSHTVHHYALIAMILRSFGVDPGPDFGVAPSTLRYWKESGRCAPQAG